MSTAGDSLPHAEDLLGVELAKLPVNQKHRIITCTGVVRKLDLSEDARGFSHPIKSQLFALYSHTCTLWFIHWSKSSRA